MIGKVVLAFVLITAVVVGILFATGTIKLKKHHKTTGKTVKERVPVAHKPYSLGIQRKKTCKYANLCNDKVLYPLKGLEVDYNIPKGSLPPIPDDCPCTQFVRSP